jgi:hypothetical protein
VLLIAVAGLLTIVASAGAQNPPAAPAPFTGVWKGEGWYHMYSTALMGSSYVGGPYADEETCTASSAAQSAPNDQCVFYSSQSDWDKDQNSSEDPTLDTSH